MLQPWEKLLFSHKQEKRVKTISMKREPSMASTAQMSCRGSVARPSWAWGHRASCLVLRNDDRQASACRPHRQGAYAPNLPGSGPTNHQSLITDYSGVILTGADAALGVPWVSDWAGAWEWAAASGLL